MKGSIDRPIIEFFRFNALGVDRYVGNIANNTKEEKAESKLPGSSG